MIDRDGGTAFPVTAGQQVYSAGMRLRHYYRAHAPVTIQDAMYAYKGFDAGHIGQLSQSKMSALFKVMAQLRDEYATAMLALDGNKEDE